MLPFLLDVRPRTPLTVLCLGAHADDIEIGCGGTVLRLLAEVPRVRVHWVVLSGSPVRAREARRSAERWLKGAAATEIQVEGFRDGFFPHQAEIKDCFERLKGSVSPDLIFTHYGRDAHQDHRVVAELTWNSFRDHTILEYEVAKYDGDLGQPQVFVPLPAAIRRKKVRLLMTAFPSQAKKRWYSEATFEALARLRGIECAAPEGYAEAFYARKLVIAPPHG